MMRKLDSLLNKLTMYKVLLYGLFGLALVCLLLSLLGTLSLSFSGMLISLIVLSAGCYLSNEILARVWRVPANSESWFITALILFFILPQATTIVLGVSIFLAGIIAMLSKFLLNLHGKHIFNPAAVAAVILGFAGLLHASWWIGSSLLWPITLIFGLLMVRKIRRGPLVLSFVLVSIATTSLLALFHHYDIGQVLKPALTASPLIFLATIMLTEPSTMPPVRRQQVIFGALVGALYAGQLSLGSFYLYPELALVIGNIYAFAVSPRYRLQLRLKTVEKISEQVYSYVFTPDRPLSHLPGQYMEWTLGHPKADARGNRRTFTIASSPTEPDIHLGVKFYQPSSTYKDTLKSMKPGDYLYAGQVAGNFVLPHDTSKKLAFIAGGIGITPFRSMIKYLSDTKQKRDIVLFYLVSKAEEIAYRDVFEAAALVGVKFIPIVNGRLDPEAIKSQLPDFTERNFYLSGPQPMVTGQKATLVGMGVSRMKIESDYFSGY